MALNAVFQTCVLIFWMIFIEFSLSPCCLMRGELVSDDLTFDSLLPSL